jgi:hypothetical protein
MVHKGFVVLTLTGLLLQILSPTDSAQLVSQPAQRPASPSSSDSGDFHKEKMKMRELKLESRRIKLRLAEAEAEKAKAEAEKANAAVAKLKIEAEMAGYTPYHELLDSALPQISDQTSKTPGSSKARLRRMPKKVSEWHGFRELVKTYREDLPPELARSSVRKMITDEPSSNLLQSGNEAELCHTLMVSLGSSLNHVFNNSVKTCSFSLSPFSVGQGLRTPDFVSFRNFSSPLQGMNSPCVSNDNSVREPKILVVGEGKRRNLAISTDQTNLACRYDDGDSHLMDAIYQLCGYQVQFKCRYGVLSNYEFTWATLLTESGELLISPAFSQGDSGPLSTMNMMRYLICRAAEEVNCGIEWMLPQDLVSLDVIEEEKKEVKRVTLAAKKDAQNDPLRGGGNEEAEVELRLLRIMVDHEDRITWQGRVEGADGARSLVAVKCYADSRSRDLEAGCFDALSTLQGQCIPTLLSRDLHLERDGERRHGLVLSWVGEADNGNYMTLPTRVLRRARGLVESMHRLGVAHGDPRAENMNYDFKTDRLFLYDFSHARMRRSPDDAAFERACREDLTSLDVAIEWSMTDAGRAIQYIP